MGQRIASVAVLIIVAVIIVDLVVNYRGTTVLVNGISGLWRNGLQAAGGQAIN